MIFNETYTLSNGVNIPKLGLGTWMINDTSVSEAVRQAVSIGYRHIDTAQAYQNEAGVGKGIQSCSVPRGDIFAGFHSFRGGHGTIEGVYADPMYGGNKDMMGWKMKRYPGNQPSYANEIEKDGFIVMEPKSLHDHMTH